MSRFSARSPAWKAKRKEILAYAEICHVCAGFLDFEAPPRSRFSPSVDHILPLSRLDEETRRALLLDDSNLRAVHYGCNSSRGNRRSPQPRRVSREWSATR